MNIGNSPLNNPPAPYPVDLYFLIPGSPQNQHTHPSDTSQYHPYIVNKLHFCPLTFAEESLHFLPWLKPDIYLKPYFLTAFGHGSF